MVRRIENRIFRRHDMGRTRCGDAWIGLPETQGLEMVAVVP